MKIYLDSNSIPENYQPYKAKSFIRPDGVTYLGRYSITVEGKERSALKKKALICIICSLGIAYLCSKELRYNIQGKRIDKLFFKKVESAAPIVKELVPYSLETVLTILQEQRDQGKKIVLYAGRRDDQNIPEEPGFFWCSLDDQMINSGLDPARPHLKVNFNEPEEMLPLKRLFEKVVVDYSVLKFCQHSPWVTFMKLLVINEDSEIIMEGHKRGNISRFACNKDAEYNYMRGEFTVYQKEFGFEADKAMQLKLNDHHHSFLHHLKPKFEKLFSSVELMVDKPYPYQAEGDIQHAHTSYWRFKGPLWKEEDPVDYKIARALGHVPEIINDEIIH